MFHIFPVHFFEHSRLSHGNFVLYEEEGILRATYVHTTHILIYG